jgi:hypothetical protein
MVSWWNGSNVKVGNIFVGKLEIHQTRQVEPLTTPKQNPTNPGIKYVQQWKVRDLHLQHLFRRVLVLEEPSTKAIRLALIAIQLVSHILADKVIDSTCGAYDTCPESNNLPGKLSLCVFSVGTETQTCTDKGHESSVPNENRVAFIAANTRWLGLWLLLLLAGFLGFFFLLPFYPFGLSSRLHVLLQEIRVNSGHMRAVDVNERSGGFGFILVNSVDIGSAAVLKGGLC